jgi:alpha-N-arabinofuranosidase
MTIFRKCFFVFRLLHAKGISLGTRAFQVDTFDDVVNFTLSNPYHIAHPNLIGAIAKSVYLIGAERNPNVVKMTAYPLSFQNLNWLNWDPDLAAFTANYDETVLSVSYYSQQMFAHHRGTETLPVTAVQGSFNPLWWVATIDDIENEMYFKVVNFG